MLNSITSNFDRISFHDSSVERIQRINSTIVLYFDWAYLNNYIEKNLSDPLVLDECKLTLENFSEEILNLTELNLGANAGANQQQIQIPGDFKSGEFTIQTDSFERDNNFSSLILTGFGWEPKEDYWTKWKINFQTGKFEWDKHVLHSDWKKGEFPTDSKSK